MQFGMQFARPGPAAPALVANPVAIAAMHRPRAPRLVAGNNNQFTTLKSCSVCNLDTRLVYINLFVDLEIYLIEG